MKKVSNKGFTLIELIVVMAIIGILVLLATPKFLNYIELANVTRIKHDTKVAEDLIIAHMVKNNGQFPKDVINIPIEKDRLEELLASGDVYSKEGLVDKDGNITINDGYFDSSNSSNISYANKDSKDIRGNVNLDTDDYFVIKKRYIKSEVRSRLKGEFIVEKNARVLYVDKLDVTTEPGGMSYTITYYDEKGEGDLPKDNKKYKLDEIAHINDGRLMYRQGYELKSWINDDENEYSLGEEVIMNKNLNLTANWKKIDDHEPPPPPTQGNLKVTYEAANGGTGIPPVDNNKYNVGDTVIILESELTPPDWANFYRWEDQDGNLYKGSQSIQIYTDLNLKSKWIWENPGQVGP